MRLVVHHMFVFAIILSLFVQSSYSILTDENLRQLKSAGNELDANTGELLAPILIPRAPGTEGSEKVQKHFVTFFSEALPSWNILNQSSTSKTPATGDREVPFTNWIFRRDPPWSETHGDVARLTLAAHFDTLMEPEGFIGAVDSALSCAILMHVARAIDEALTAKWTALDEVGDHTDNKGVQIIFLDGEEAFHEWSETDSLYGAR